MRKYHLLTVILLASNIIISLEAQVSFGSPERINDN